MRLGPPTGPAGLWLFAVEPDAAQLTWAALPPGTVSVDVDPGPAHPLEPTPHPGGPGAVTLRGLRPATSYVVELRLDDRRVGARRFRTLDALAGNELTRFATVSDIHIGDTGFGIVVKQRAPELEDGFPTACAKAALAEAVAWGAQAIIVKGDLTHSSRTAELERAADLLSTVPVPVIGVLGNHDVVRKGVDAAALLARRHLDIGPGTRVLDLPGIRTAVLPTAHPGQHGPSIEEQDLDELTAAIAVADRPAWIGLHHYLQPLAVPLTYPPGLPRAEASRLLRAVATANPRVLLSTGHSHRCRRHHRLGVSYTEVGAPKDFPGVWAGYRVHEDGVHQSVFRVADPAAMAWNDRTRKAAGHVWGWYSPGTLAQRCFTHRWP